MEYLIVGIVVGILLLIWGAMAYQKQVEDQEAIQQQQAVEAARTLDETEVNKLNKILAIIDGGKVPEINWGSVPFKLLKNERLVYTFYGVQYMERRTKREVVGRSAGVSVRVMKGVSVRTGASKGTPIETDEWVARGFGTFGITNKHLYFSGDRSFRIPFTKIVAVEQLDIGVEVTRDRASGHPEVFLLHDHLYVPFATALIHGIQGTDYGRTAPESESLLDAPLPYMGYDDVADDEVRDE